MLTIYKASAGSGKTFTLAYEYIKTLLGVKVENGDYRLNSDKYAPAATEGQEAQGNFALTFTNAATDEMKRRIVKQINSLTEDDAVDKSDYAARLIKRVRLHCRRIAAGCYNCAQRVTLRLHQLQRQHYRLIFPERAAHFFSRG